MAHPTCWPSTLEFDPMGLDPAVSLTQDLSPEQSADILLLGCGDTRHILYTLSTDVTCPPVPRKLDITCCDIEPAVLARNIIVLTLLNDNAPSNHVWDIFYHFKLTDYTYDLVTTHSRKLANVAESLESWHQSSYGSLIKLIDAASLSELRRLWTLYANFSHISPDRVEKLQKEQVAISARVSLQARSGVAFGLSRSAAGMWRDALEPVNLQFAEYWERGTTSPVQKDIEKTRRLNPTFCYSKLGETFGVYDQSFPQGYHFAPAFTPLVLDPVGPATNSAMSKAKQQFKAGCLSFQASRQAGSIILRFFVGEALSFCRALDLFSKTRNPRTEEFAAPWKATPIDLTEHATLSPPWTFDVIDTSDLSTDLGLFNILLATQPLLKKQPASHAVLYTDEGLEKRTAPRDIHKRLHGNVPTIGLLLGLVPRSYISLFTTMSNTHMYTITDRHTTIIERIAWVDPASGDPRPEPSPVLYSPPANMLQLLLGVYREMVQDELSTGPSQFFFLSQLRSTSEPHHTRETFVRFIAHVRSRVFLREGDQDWADIMGTVRNGIREIGADMGLITHLPDLETQYDLYQLPVNSRSSDSLRVSLAQASVFDGWTDIPQVVCMVLIVPSEKLNFLKRDRVEPWPRLVCELGADDDDQYITFSSLQTAWGKLVPLPDSHGQFGIEEDPQEFRGASDLLVSFWIDATLASWVQHVSLCVRNTPHAKVKYGSLGPRMRWHMARMGGDQVRVLRERPMAGRTQTAMRYISPLAVDTGGIKCRINTIEGQGGSAVSTSAILMVGKDALAEVKKAMIQQLGPCTLEIGFGDEKRVVRLPYPVNATECKAALVKSKGRIDITAPFPDPTDVGGYPARRFPVVRCYQPSPWNLHHIFVDRMPIVDIQQRSKLRRWLIEHTMIQMSDREHKIQKDSHPSERPPTEVLVNVKETIFALVQDYAGVRIPGQPSMNTVGLAEPAHGRFAIILIGGLRLDLAGATLALDCAVIPLSLESADELSPGIKRLHDLTEMLEIKTYLPEAIAWKHLLPAYVERMRTWPHKSDCAYKVANAIPLSENMDVDPLCKCGRGLGFTSAEWQVPAWKGLLPYATRAAISPLFGVALLEGIGSQKATIEDSQPKEVCWQCGASGKPLLLCTRCRKAKYCSKGCQTAHWKRGHKQECKAP